MAWSTTDTEQQAAADRPAYRKLQSAVLAVCLVLAPLVIALGFALDPELGVPHWGSITILAWQHANPLRIQWLFIVNLITLYVFPLSYLGLGLLALKRSPWLATIGIACGLMGSLPWPLFLTTESLIYNIVHMGNSAAFIDLLARVSSVWEIAFLQYSWVLGHLLGYVLLGIALIRARTIPLWASCLIIIGVPFQMIAYPANQGIFQILGFVLIFIASIPAALAILKK
jgi:hypothetical protein